MEETLPKGKALEGFVMTSIQIFTLHYIGYLVLLPLYPP